MKSWSITIAVLCMIFVFGTVPARSQDLLMYEVLSIEPGTWVVTAKETRSGEVVSFRLPPESFKGKTFDADLGDIKKGRRFSVRGPRNARLSNLVMHRTASRGDSPLKRRPRKPIMHMAGGTKLPWVIKEVAKDWMVTAFKMKSGETIKFKVDPNSFKGFRFRANIKGISKGQGFSLYAPNQGAITSACTLMEHRKK